MTIGKRPEDKGLLNELLPDPTVRTGGGSPRERTAAHLRRVLAAAAGLAIGASAHADVSPPKGGDPGDKNRPVDMKKPEPDDRAGYSVVDELPPPPEQPKKPGLLRLDSRPSGARITLDGRDLKLKTPQTRLKLSPGTHALTLTTPDGKRSGNFTVEIKGGETLRSTFDLPERPADPPKR